MEFDNIIKKYNYSPKLATFLKKILEELINIFGLDKEPLIYEALLNTEIVDCESNYAYLNSHFTLSNDDSITLISDLDKASGVCYSDALIDYDESTKTFSLKSINRVILINNLSSNESYVLGSLIHELCHLIKNYYREYTIENDILTVRQGLIESIYQLSYENGIVKRRLISEKGVGLEEGLNTILEYAIARKLIDPNYQTTGYLVLKELASILTDTLGLKTPILNAEVMKEKAAFIEYFDSLYMKGAYLRFESILDKIYVLTLKQTKVSDKGLINAIASQIDSLIKQELKALLSEMSMARLEKKVA